MGKLKQGLGDEDELGSLLEKLDKEILRIRNLPEMEMLGTIEEADNVDWMRVSSVSFNGNRTPAELRSNWVNVYHPSISGKAWTRDEDDLLKSLVETYGVRGQWGTISKEMINRSVYQCFTRYQQEHNPSLGGVTSNWTEQEEDMLLNVVDQVRNNELVPWALVSTFMGNRNHNDCKRHYYKVLYPPRPGRWTPEEDQKLLRIVKIFGDKAAWWRVAHYMGGARSYYQCRDRYELQLRHERKSTTPWYYEEDKLIYQTMKSHDFTGQWRNYMQNFKKRSARELYHRSVRIQTWEQYCNSLVGSHNALSLSAVTEPGHAQEVKDEWIRALLPPGVPIDLAHALFRPEMEGTPAGLERDLCLIQADRMKGIFIPHPPANLASLSEVHCVAKHRDFVTGMLQTVAQKAEAEKMGKPEPKKSQLMLDHSILEKYLTSDKGANVSEQVKEKLRKALKNAEKMSMKAVAQLCCEMRTEILTLGKRRVTQSERMDEKLAAIIQARKNSRKTGNLRRGHEKGYVYHLRTKCSNVVEDLTNYVDEDETRIRMANLLAQALEINQESIIARYDAQVPPEDKRLQQLIACFGQIEDGLLIEGPAPPERHGEYRVEPEDACSRNEEKAATNDDGDDTRSSSSSKKTIKCLPNLWRGQTFPSEKCPAPLPPNHHTLFAFRNILLDRRKLLKGVGKFLANSSTKDIWYSREFARDPEFEDLLSRFVTLFMWPALLSAMPVAKSEHRPKTPEPMEPRPSKRKRPFPCAISFKKRLWSNKRLKSMAETKQRKDEMFGAYVDGTPNESSVDSEMDGEESIDGQVTNGVGHVQENGHVSREQEQASISDCVTDLEIVIVESQ